MTYPILGNYFPSTYQKYVPQAFDNSLDLYEQMTAVIAFLNQIVDNFNSLSNTTQGDLTTIAEVVNTLNDSLETFKSNLENEVLPTNLVAILENWLANGTLADILTTELLDNKANVTDLTALQGQFTDLENDVEGQLGTIGTVVNQSLSVFQTPVTHYLTEAEKADILLANPVLDHSASIQAYVNAMAANGWYTLFFPKGTYRFTNINLGNKEWNILGTDASGYMQDTRFRIIAATNSLAFTGQNRYITFKNIRVESTGNKADGLNAGLYKNTLVDGNFITAENMNISKFSGTLFDVLDIIDSQFIRLKINSVKKIFRFGLASWDRGTTVLVDQGYFTNADTVFDCDHTTESRLTNTIIEFCGMGHINEGSWTIDNVYFENNVSNLYATNSRLTLGFVFDLTALDEIINTQDGLDYFNRGKTRVTHLGGFFTRLESDYEAAGMAIEANYDTGIWYEIGEWVANKVGAQMKITFNGGAGYNQQAGGDGRLAVCGETVLYVTQANNANPSLPNAVAYAKHNGPSPAIAELKVVSTNSERTMFKVYAKTQPYASRVGVQVQTGHGYFLKRMVENVADPGAASSVVVSVPFEV